MRSKEENRFSSALKDPRLSWNASKLEVTNINHKKVWTPDISYWNSVSEDSGFDSLKLFMDRLYSGLQGPLSVVFLTDVMNPLLRFSSIEGIIEDI